MVAHSGKYNRKMNYIPISKQSESSSLCREPINNSTVNFKSEKKN